MSKQKISEMRRRVYWPKLTEANHEITSEPDPLYNCVAWAANETAAWWWPADEEEYYWPDDAPREETVEAFIAAFALQGYERCDTANLEPGYLKVAIYADEDGPGHMARQLADGQWTSKLGRSEDIRHSLLEDVETRQYGTARQYMRRRVAGG